MPKKLRYHPNLTMTLPSGLRPAEVLHRLDSPMTLEDLMRSLYMDDIPWRLEDGLMEMTSLGLIIFENGVITRTPAGAEFLRLSRT